MTYRRVYFNIAHSKGPTVTLRCPHCAHVGTMQRMENVNDVAWSSGDGMLQDRHAGVRRCPNPECFGLIFTVCEHFDLAESYPPQVIDFDASNLPDSILRSLEEAVKCHAAGAYKASALMVRRLLEELCADRGATGKDLKSRLTSLGSASLLPAELLEAADELRVLGNDAAHIDARDYDSIGEVEAALAVDLAKELLKATYQYSSLVEKLRALKRTDDGAA
jgi:hypothetical protein